MAVIVKYDSADATVPNRVTKRISSGNTPEYQGDPDTLINPDESGVTLPLYYRVAVPGSNSVRDMTAQEQADVDAAAEAAADAATRAGAKDEKKGFASSPLYRRAVADLIMDELNILRQWLTDFKAETAASTSLADFQSRIAGLPDTPDRVFSQIKTAIDNRIDSGEVDPD